MKEKLYPTLCASSLLMTFLLSGNVLAQEEGGEKTPQPKIVCEQSTFDFGKQSSEVDVPHTFIIKNEGDAPLEITEVKAGCGCTTAALKDKIVQPGEETGITASLSLARREGHQKKWIRVACNDPVTPSLTLWFQGKAVKPFNYSPKELAFGTLETKPEQSHSIRLTAGTDQTFTVLSVETGTASLQAETITVTEGKEYDVTFTTHPPFEEEAEYVVSIKTDLEEQPLVEIPMALSTGIGKVSVVPEKVVVETVENKMVNRQVMIGVPGLDAFKVTRVDTPDPSIRFMIRKFKPNLFQVEFKNVPANDSINGKTASIHTDIEGYETLTVPFEYRP